MYLLLAELNNGNYETIASNQKRTLSEARQEFKQKNKMYARLKKHKRIIVVKLPTRCETWWGGL